MNYLWLLFVFMAFAFSGCARDSGPAEKDKGVSPSGSKPSAVQKTIEDVTGRTTTRLGKKTMQQIETINASRKEQMDEVTQ